MSEALEIEEVTFLTVGGRHIAEMGQTGSPEEGQWIARLPTGTVVGTLHINAASVPPVYEINGVQIA